MTKPRVEGKEGEQKIGTCTWRFRFFTRNHMSVRIDVYTGQTARKRRR